MQDAFEALAREYFDVKRNGIAEKTFTKRQQRFEKFAFPKLGSRPIAKISAPEFLAMLKAVEARGTTRLHIASGLRAAKCSDMRLRPAAPSAT